jgi:predicted ATP-binding protein involved in virulence
MSTSYIKRIEISKLWGKYDIVWDNLHPDVNILVGINGSGKSTLLGILSALFSEKIDINKFNFESVELKGLEYRDISNKFNFSFKYVKAVGGAHNLENEFQVEYISTFDVPTDKYNLEINESPLMLEIRKLLYLTGGNSFNDYRLKATISIEKAIEVNNRLINLFKKINHFFKNTGKVIEIDLSNNIVFVSEKDTISLEQLSAGEKQLLLILFKVFLMDEKPSVLIMDEPEISMHLGWQQDLIKTIRELNPNCQLIIATHSPSIFGKGWGDKITFMEKLFM